MPPTPRSAPELEIAHVLFVDVVGYSQLAMDEQLRLFQQLQDLIRQTTEARRAEGGGDLLRIPSGDGMALVFFRDPVAPVRCAMELARAAQKCPDFRLRMGLHTGPVYRVEDVNAQANVSGGGINLAERVMNCGAAGHILLSREIAGLLTQVGAWPLEDLGECEVKHGVRLHLFNLYADGVGNPTPLMKPRPRQSSSRPAPALDHAGEAPETGERVALLYKRHAHPDEELVKLLERRLEAEGYQVFVDRHLSIGVEWAQAIERQVRTADAVIPLLSGASVHSETLAYEVQWADEAASRPEGGPRLLPVRVDYAGSLPEPLVAFLHPLQFALWESHQDDERLVADLLHALRNPPAPKPSVSWEKSEPPGGSVPLESEFYIGRPTDEAFHAAIARQDSIVLVKGARQTGKTSLLARGLQQARELGATVVMTDFQVLDPDRFESVGTLFLTLAEWIADQLDLDALPEQAWNPNRGANLNFWRYLRREVLAKIPGPLIWGLDEVDRLFTCDFGSQVFGLFRSWHNERSLDPSSPWRRATLAIAYATEAHLFISDLNQSPFNVGTRVTLDDFTQEQVAELNRRHGSPLRDPAELARFHRLVGGHPYLVRRGLYEMAVQNLGITALEAQAERDEGLFGDHLRRILVLLARDPELCDVVRAVLRGGPCPTADSFYRLRSAGLITGESAREARPRCQLYASYLVRHLL